MVDEHEMSSRPIRRLNLGAQPECAGIGALIASEFIVGWRTFDPAWDGLAIVPALIGGLVLGLIVDVVTRYLTGGTYAGRPTAA